VGQLDDRSRAFRDEVDAIVTKYADGDPQQYARRWKQLQTWGMDRSQGDPVYKARLKKRLLARAGGHCEDCLREFTPTELQMHRLDTAHAFDKAKHFGYFDDNIALLCASCHDNREDERRRSDST
jgi:hypothetical protein